MQELIPITLFICVAQAISALADARARSRLAAPHIAEDVIHALVRLEEKRRLLSGLRWGVSLLCLGVAFAVLELLGARELSFGAAAALVGSAGMGQLVGHWLTRRAISATA